LGKQIAVDGIFGKETLAAIKNFQTQHSDILKVDGLVGDKTLSALGITGLADSSLPQTRPGQNQSRGSEKKPKGMSDADYEYQKNYYTSPEMISYLTNTTNAITDPEYINHYYNALNFVSPEIASRLRVINNEGDAYDEDVVANRNQASARRIGIQ
jgi:peptidoglycan hydrolase-like protein with peptidoglycan-binding domain